VDAGLPGRGCVVNRAKHVEVAGVDLVAGRTKYRSRRAPSKAERIQLLDEFIALVEHTHAGRRAARIIDLEDQGLPTPAVMSIETREAYDRLLEILARV
jgi:hypothetical protein